MTKTATSELIVRELSGLFTNAGTILTGGSELSSNAARFFNDLEFDLYLVALRMGAIQEMFIELLNVADTQQQFGIVEVSRQAQFGQQEGVIGSVRSRAGFARAAVAAGGGLYSVGDVGEIYIGDFHTPLMTLETQTNIFLNLAIVNGIQSLSVGIATATLQAGCTLYFRRKGR